MKKPRERINPQQYAESGSEDAAQIALFIWAAENVDKYPELKFMFAIPNGMFTPSKSVAGRMRAMGMKKGVSDVCLPVRRGPWSGFYIEMKKPPMGKRPLDPTPEQDEFGKFVQSQGYAFMVCHGFEPARDNVIEYLCYGVEPVRPVEVKMSSEDLKQFDSGWR